MPFPNHVLSGAALGIPALPHTTVASVSPIVLPAPDRKFDMELRVTAPTNGTDLPIVLLSHGQGESNWLSSLAGYEPLYSFWAGQGFVVIEPTHESSGTYGLFNASTAEQLAQHRAEDMTWLIDYLDDIEAAVPIIKGRMDKNNIAAAGHSFGGWITSMLLGATNTNPNNGTQVSNYDKRIKAGVILAGTGNGGDDLSDEGRRRMPFYGPDFSKMQTPALVIYGDEDVTPYLTVRGADWHGDAYYLAPGPSDLFIVQGGHHGLGGVSGWDAEENVEDEGPERLASVQRMTSAYLRTALYGDSSWSDALAALNTLPSLGSAKHK